jgi:ParB family chromosome partitioning protein
MKANGPKRKIFDAVDVLTADVPENGTKDQANRVQMIPVDRIRAFHDHPFRLYEGERLNDMIESIREHGILNPVIVRRVGGEYEMLSGHNRQNAAAAAGLKEIPAVVKEGISDEEAYIYVIETNLMQRSFADLLPSEKATVLEVHYDRVCCQGKRNDIIRELKILNGETPDATCGHNGHKLKSRDVVAEEYGLSSRNAARYLRLNKLIRPFKDLVDRNGIAMLAAVDVSFLTEDEQEMVYGVLDAAGIKLKPKMAEELRRQSGDLTEEKVRGIIDSMTVRKAAAPVRVKLPDGICKKYFSGMDEAQMTDVIAQALEAWFMRNNGAGA